MRGYKDDCPVKIPNWYMKLPTNVIVWISDTGLAIDRWVRKRKRRWKTK